MQPPSLRCALTVLTAMLAAATPPAWAQGQAAPKYSARVPPSIQTPDTVQTRIGTLAGSRGIPS